MQQTIAKLSYGLTSKQVATVAFIGTFVTVIGAVALVYWFRRTNRKGN